MNIDDTVFVGMIVILLVAVIFLLKDREPAQQPTPLTGMYVIQTYELADIENRLFDIERRLSEVEQ